MIANVAALSHNNFALRDPACAALGAAKERPVANDAAAPALARNQILAAGGTTSPFSAEGLRTAEEAAVLLVTAAGVAAPAPRAGEATGLLVALLSVVVPGGKTGSIAASPMHR
jgi:hypothetical protein